VPPSVDAYVHRSGRTARAAADGVSLCLIGPDELRQWQAITRQLNLNVASLHLPRELNEAARKRERWGDKCCWMGFAVGYNWGFTFDNSFDCGCCNFVGYVQEC